MKREALACLGGSYSILANNGELLEIPLVNITFEHTPCKAKTLNLCYTFPFGSILEPFFSPS